MRCEKGRWCSTYTLTFVDRFAKTLSCLMLFSKHVECLHVPLAAGAVSSATLVFDSLSVMQGKLYWLCV